MSGSSILIFPLKNRLRRGAAQPEPGVSNRKPGSSNGANFLILSER